MRSRFRFDPGRKSAVPFPWLSAIRIPDGKHSSSPDRWFRMPCGPELPSFAVAFHGGFLRTAFALSDDGSEFRHQLSVMLLCLSQRLLSSAIPLVGKKRGMRFTLALNAHKEAVRPLFLLVNPADAWCSFETSHIFFQLPCIVALHYTIT